MAIAKGIDYDIRPHSARLLRFGCFGSGRGVPSKHHRAHRTDTPDDDAIRPSLADAIRHPFADDVAGTIDGPLSRAVVASEFSANGLADRCPYVVAHADCHTRVVADSETDVVTDNGALVGAAVRGRLLAAVTGAGSGRLGRRRGYLRVQHSPAQSGRSRFADRAALRGRCGSDRCGV